MAIEVTLRLSPREASSSKFYLPIAAKKANVAPQTITTIVERKRSIDARRSQIWVNLKVFLYLDNEPVESDFPEFQYPDVSSKKQVVVVGAGPAGLFAALRLIEKGLKPIVLERGKNVSDRKRDLALIHRSHLVDEDSNYGFGEGGAGTFSDGKLYTRSVKRGNVKRILQVFCYHGANRQILVDAHPHIGTDKLPKVIKNIRQTIINAGGEVHFSTRVTDLIMEGDCIKGVNCLNGSSYYGPVILATGHSARDVYQMLKPYKYALEPKTFAMGVRIEHPQELIDQIQYHSPKGRGEYLEAAAYNLTTQVDGRGVYSFCMCPGGYIVPAATGPEEQVVNGMSPSGRNSAWANSGLVVEIRPEDLPDGDKLFAGLQFQQQLERDCFIHANRSLQAPAQRMSDYVRNKISQTLPASSYIPGLISSNLKEWLPAHIGKRLASGISYFGKRIPGFLTQEAILTGVESRTSSPLRIPRSKETFEHVSIKGLYPCGEGAGYAGGIVSSAIDGENCAEALANNLFN